MHNILLLLKFRLEELYQVYVPPTFLFECLIQVAELQFGILERIYLSLSNILEFFFCLSKFSSNFSSSLYQSKKSIPRMIMSLIVIRTQLKVSPKRFEHLAIITIRTNNSEILEFLKIMQEKKCTSQLKFTS